MSPNRAVIELIEQLEKTQQEEQQQPHEGGSSLAEKASNTLRNRQATNSRFAAAAEAHGNYTRPNDRGPPPMAQQRLGNLQVTNSRFVALSMAQHRLGNQQDTNLRSAAAAEAHRSVPTTAAHLLLPNNNVLSPENIKLMQNHGQWTKYWVLEFLDAVGKRWQ